MTERESGIFANEIKLSVYQDCRADLLMTHIPLLETIAKLEKIANDNNEKLEYYNEKIPELMVKIQLAKAEGEKK